MGALPLLAKKQLSSRASSHHSGISRRYGMGENGDHTHHSLTGNLITTCKALTMSHMRIHHTASSPHPHRPQPRRSLTTIDITKPDQDHMQSTHTITKIQCTMNHAPQRIERKPICLALPSYLEREIHHTTNAPSSISINFCCADTP